MVEAYLERLDFPNTERNLRNSARPTPKVELSIAIEDVLKGFTPLDWSELPASLIVPRK
jgi:hypothetical protein